MRFRNRSNPGTALRRAFALGEALELGGNSVAATTISALLAGAVAASPGRIPALKLRGARITGELNLSGGTVTCEIDIDRCRFEQAPKIVGAITRMLSITNSELPGLDCSWASIEGHLNLSGSTITRTTLLLGTKIAGELTTNGTRLRGDGVALNMSGATLHHSWFGRNGFHVRGEIKAHGARFHAGMFLEGALLDNPGGQTFRAEHAVIEGQMEWSKGLRSHGVVWLRDSVIPCTFSLDGSELTALNVSRAEIHELVLTPRRPVEGEVSFSNATIRVLTDDAATWPPSIRTDGLAYQTLPAAVPLTDRLGWLGRHPDGYHGQAYEQLASYYRALGQDDMARRVLLAKQRCRRRTLPPLGRAWSAVVDWTVGYGYRPGQSTVWLLGLLATGTAVFALQPPQLTDPGNTAPYFHPSIYTVDLLNPLGSFGVRAAYTPVEWTAWVAYGLMVAGWILATAVVASVARTLKRT